MADLLNILNSGCLQYTKRLVYSLFSRMNASYIFKNIFSFYFPIDFFHTNIYLSTRASNFVPSINIVFLIIRPFDPSDAPSDKTGLLMYLPEFSTKSCNCSVIWYFLTSQQPHTFIYNLHVSVFRNKKKLHRAQPTKVDKKGRHLESAGPLTSLIRIYSILDSVFYDNFPSLSQDRVTVFSNFPIKVDPKY